MPTERPVYINYAAVIFPCRCFQDGCLEFNLGVCRDVAMVFYNREQIEDGGGIQINTVAMFISDSSFLSVSLYACFRHVSTVRDKQLGFRGNVRFEGRPP